MKMWKIFESVVISSLVHCSAHHPVGGACSPEWSNACTKWPVAMAATAQQSWSPLRTGSVILGRVMWKSMWTPSPPLDWVRLTFHDPIKSWCTQSCLVLHRMSLNFQFKPEIRHHHFHFIFWCITEVTWYYWILLELELKMSFTI